MNVSQQVQEMRKLVPELRPDVTGNQQANKIINAAISNYLEILDIIFFFKSKSFNRL